MDDITRARRKREDRREEPSVELRLLQIKIEKQIREMAIPRIGWGGLQPRALVDQFGRPLRDDDRSG